MINNNNEFLEEHFHMRSLIIKTPFEVDIHESPIPIVGAGEVLLKLKYVGFCGSDLSSYKGNNPMVSYPRIPGHEVSGEIVGLGDDVPDHIVVGLNATVNPYSNCGKCSSCKRYRPNACQFNQTLGVQRDGAMSEYLVVHWKKIILADSLSPEKLVLVEPLTVGFHAVERGRVIDFDCVVVFGCGLIGLGAVLAAVEKQAEIIVVDFDSKKLSLAKELGAKYVVNASEVDVDEYFQEKFHGKIDVVIEASGSSAAFTSALKAVAFSGRVVCIGYTKEPILLESKLIIQKEIDLLGSRNALQADFDRVVRYLTTKKLPVEKLISRKISMSESELALKEWNANPNEIIKMVMSL